jgi:hypothetical protein
MARKSTKRQASSKKSRPFQPRDLLFAGLGVVSLGRKQADRLRSEVRAKAAPVKRTALALVKDARAQIEASIRPALIRLGIRKEPARRSSRRAA